MLPTQKLIQNNMERNQEKKNNYIMGIKKRETKNILTKTFTQKKLPKAQNRITFTFSSCSDKPAQLYL